jgi:hypothetical protein
LRTTTLLPAEDWRVEGLEGDSYKVGPNCERPGCKRFVDHQHHLWRRSFLGRPKRHSEEDYRWVRLPNGDTVRNVIGLCWQHHEMVTGRPGGHQAWVKWVPDSHEFQWLERDAIDNEWREIGTLSLPAPTEAAPNGTPGREAERPRCPTCGRVQKKPEPEHEPGPKRPRASWTVKVPADHEDGAAVLDELVEGVADLMGAGEWGTWKRYHAVVSALAFTLQNAGTFGQEWLGVQTDGRGDT